MFFSPGLFFRSPQLRWAGPWQRAVSSAHGTGNPGKLMAVPIPGDGPFVSQRSPFPGGNPGPGSPPSSKKKISGGPGPFILLAGPGPMGRFGA